QVRAEIAELQERTKTTMMYVTHDQVEAMTLGHRVAVMDKCRLQQVATPRDVYDAPANAFVAGFIGNPPMNLFATRVRVDGDAATLTLGAQTIAIARARAAALPADVREGSLTAGIRPEHLRLGDASGEASPNAASFAAVVEHVEWLGHETLAYVHVADTAPAAARAASSPVDASAAIPFVAR